MQQFTRTCQVADHQQRLIEYVCIYPECNLSRFLCSKCTLEQSHKHNLQNNSHILDQIDFCKKVEIKIHEAKVQQHRAQQDMKQSVSSLSQMILDIQILLKNVENDNIEAICDMEYQLANISNKGFHSIDEQSLNNLLNLKDRLNNDPNIYKQLQNYTNILIQNAVKVKDIFQQKQIQNLKYSLNFLKEMSQQKIQWESILSAKNVLKTMFVPDILLSSHKNEKQKALDYYNKSVVAISNNFKYIVAGVEDWKLNVWDYNTNNPIQSIQMDEPVRLLKFTEDSTLLYAGGQNCIYQFAVNDEFKKLNKQKLYSHVIQNIYCVTNTTILTSYERTIIVTDLKLQKELLKIRAHQQDISALDFNQYRNIIASGSSDRSIKLWNTNGGTLILEKQISDHIKQVLFNTKENSLISLHSHIIIIWNINYKASQLEQRQLIQQSGYNISLVLEQQYIIIIGENLINVYTIDGQIIRQFKHGVDQMIYYNTIQPDSLRAILILGEGHGGICKFELDQ